MTMPRHVTDMDNKELGKFIIDQMALVESGYITEAKQAALAFQDAGIEAGCFVKPGGANLTPRETMLWYAGQMVSIANNEAWYAVNSMINCLDRFVVQPSQHG